MASMSRGEEEGTEQDPKEVGVTLYPLSRVEHQAVPFHQVLGEAQADVGVVEQVVEVGVGVEEEEGDGWQQEPAG